MGIVYCILVCILYIADILLNKIFKEIKSFIKYTNNAKVFLTFSSCLNFIMDGLEISHVGQASIGFRSICLCLPGAGILGVGQPT